MRNPHAVALHLASWARSERAAQEESLAALEEQERAVRQHDLGALEASTALAADLGRRAGTRARRRDQLMGELARMWSVPQGALTLGSVSERLGPDGQELASLRAELRDGASRLLRSSRRVGTLVSAFRRLNQEVVELLLTDDDGSPLHRGGALVDAEA